MRASRIDPAVDIGDIGDIGDKRTDIIVNRKASRLRADDGLRRIIATAAARGGARLHETRDLDDLHRVATEIAGHGSHAVVLAGGDGSHMAGLSALARAFSPRPVPRIGLAPGGTVCTVARNLGMRGRSRVVAERVIRAACNPAAPIEHRATLRVRDDGGGDRVGFIFGAGLVVRFFGAYYGGPRQGRLAAAKLVGRIFAGSFTGGRLAATILQPTRCSLTVDGARPAGQEWTLILASVVRDVGLHLLVPYRAGEELGRFHVVASGLHLHALAEQLPRVLVGRPLRGEPRVDSLARSVRIAFEGDDGGYVLDGDVFPARALTVEAGPVVSLVAI